MPADGGPFFLVTLQEPLVSSTRYRGKLPCEVGGILDSGVHSLAANRRVDVGGVANEERVVLAVVSRLAIVDIERRHPSGGMDFDSNFCPIERGLKILDRQFLFGALLLPGVESHDQARVLLRELGHEHHITLVQKEGELIGRRVGAIDFDISQEK